MINIATREAEENRTGIERVYGAYHATIHFSAEDVPDAGKNLLESIMHSYAERRKLLNICDMGVIRKLKE